MPAKAVESLTARVAGAITQSGVASLRTVSMPARRRFAAALSIGVGAVLLAPLGLVTGTAAASPSWQPAAVTQDQNGAECPVRESPPAAPSDTEGLAEGESAPPPLPVPDEPVGGERLGECGEVLPEGAPPAPADVTAASWVVADLGSGEVLAARDPHGRHRPAATMKILTALVALRDLGMEDIVVGTPEDVAQGGAAMGIAANTEYTTRQVVNGLVMASGNDAANALARQLGGIPATLDRMNAVAEELGALDTRATTPSGLEAPGISTSAYDVTLFLREALDNEDYLSAFSSPELPLPGGSLGPLVNDSDLLANYPGALGGRDSFTDDARYTFAGAAERDGRRLGVVLLRGEPVTPMWQQAASLLDYGFALPADAAVGTLNTSAPEPEAAPDASEGGASSAGDEGAEPVTAQDQPRLADRAGDTSMFGSFGLPLTILAGVVVLFFTVLTLRDRAARRKAAARRAAQQREEAAKATEDWLWPPPNQNPPQQG